MMIIFDIETGPCGDDELKAVYEPPELPAHPGEFDESSVKLGGLKDKEKIQAKIDASRQKHQQAVQNYDRDCQAKLQQYWEEFKDRAALDPLTGQVLAIGYLNPDMGKVAIDSGDEPEMLTRFWTKARSCRDEHRCLIGLNIHDFDLPFLMRRSWMLGVEVPDWIIRQDRYFDAVFVDLRKRWMCGQWSGSGVKSNFDYLGKAFRTGGKQDGVDGSQFAELWRNDREKAIAYLENDLKQPAEWARRMGVL